MEVNRMTIELFREADNEVGSEHMEIIVNPALIGLHNEKGEDDYYLTLKSEDGFSFEDAKEIMDTLENVVKMVEQCKNIKK
jgi:ethanolamine utilization protein EutA (predicted chaperonin)